MFSTLDSVSDTLLKQGGYALLSLSNTQQNVIAKGFRCGRESLEKMQSLANENKNVASVVRCILDTDDSAHAVGYHSSGGMSRYNSHREGFVFSDGAMFSMESMVDFEECMKDMQECLHTIANQVMKELGRKLDLPHGWFEENFLHESKYSQWHLKRYVTESDDVSASGRKEKKEDDIVLLPSHTDPSLISVVILDQPGQQAGAMGLQVFEQRPGQETREWTELGSSGHAVATVFVGSVMFHITGGFYAAAKHRVVQVDGATDRMAATFFLRPRGSAILTVPPSPALQGVCLKKKEATFDSWSSRVSKNYMKQKNQGTKTSIPSGQPGVTK